MKNLDNPSQLAVKKRDTSLARWQSFFQRPSIKILCRQTAGLVGLIVLILLTLIGIAAPFLAPYDPLNVKTQERFLPPSPQHLFGTDEFGRDVLSRIIWGIRISLGYSAAGVLLGLLGGVPLGLITGYFGGTTDQIVMRILDVVLAFPAILLAMFTVAVMGPSSLVVMVAIALINIPTFARIVRANTLSLREQEFVEASRAGGAHDGYLLGRIILPNCLPAILVQTTISVAFAILLESALSFLGLGTQPPDPSWGTMLNSGRSHLYRAPWLGIFPGMAITLLVLSLNFLADALQLALNPATEQGSKPSAS